MTAQVPDSRLTSITRSVDQSDYHTRLRSTTPAACLRSSISVSDNPTAHPELASPARSGQTPSLHSLSPEFDISTSPNSAAASAESAVMPFSDLDNDGASRCNSIVNTMLSNNSVIEPERVHSEVNVIPDEVFAGYDNPGDVRSSDVPPPMYTQRDPLLPICNVEDSGAASAARATTVSCAPPASYPTTTSASHSGAVPATLVTRTGKNRAGRPYTVSFPRPDIDARVRDLQRAAREEEAAEEQRRQHRS
ncbi:hypothetical protein DACRYDRAFT_16377 [Dacryopinax primogenitus]|uniref:Uncharacterized protein n=1 Tax=Dacryopinax primogenitus (strain DJM 731) TaxID=1858805 RepID=M5G596_DACPD|nr:uncharacterized protein DACRYDRAFT_16377 [Dacryopinax primogenitus]EJU01002.1 hypothetical protein DACRYDRAFT_16377 [Dacryopinax primogenitus]